jgi:AraC-like DNA-binding protein
MEVIYEVGFNELKYFRKCFKDEFGITSSEYKKQFKE